MENRHPKIPNKWVMTTIEDISKSIYYGYTAKSRNEPIGPKYLRITDIQNDKVDWSKVPYCDIEKSKINKYVLKPGEIVFARTGATVGKSYQIKDNVPEAIFASYLIKIIPSGYIINKYISYYFKSTLYWTQISEGKIGIGQPNVNATKLKKITIPIPPYNEQIRIVSKIKELISRLDSGVKAIQETQQQIKHYRQSLFNDLFSFKFDIYNKITIGRILEPSKERFNPLDDKAAAYIGLADIESNTGRILNIRKSSETKSLKSVFHPDDLLYGRLRPYLNKVAVPNFYGVCSTDIIVFKSSDKINHNYLQYVLMSNKYVSYATNNMSGVHLPRIKFNEMAKFIIPYPPLEVQNKIHTEYEKRLSVINNMVINTEQCKSQSELLKQLILQKAFGGRLVPQDPRDEPASALLERIKAKKGLLKSSQKRGKRRREIY